MAGTFYINSGFVGLPGYMTRDDLADLDASGHEIGGHTVSHASLPAIPADEANRQVCQDRNTLLSWGYAVTSFAYPYADFDAATKSIVAQCGYNTARAVGDIWSPHSCGDCDNAETIPPADGFESRTPDDIDTTWTLANLQDSVLRAENTGGWLAFNLHHVCDGCALESISPAVLDEFLAWLKPRSSSLIRTNVKTVNQVVGGPVQAAVPPTAAPAPGAPGVNTVRNASLETVSTGDPNLPDCWNAAGYGTNAQSYARVTDAHSGGFAERITMTSHTDGDAKLVPTFDLGRCASSVTTGHRYELSSWYKSSAQVFFTVYRRNQAGHWSYWTQSPRLASASGWTKATWVSPPIPSGTTAVSFGLTLDSVGAVTTDDYGFADVPALPPPALAGENSVRNASLEIAGADGFPQCWMGAGYGANSPTWTRVTDAADGDYAQRLDLASVTDGDAKLIPTFDSANCAPTVTEGHPYRLGVSYKSDAPTFFTLYRQDAAGTWSYWTQSPTFPAAAEYTTASWQSPAVPAGTTAVSFGLTLDAAGSVTTDNYSLVDAS